MIQLGPSLFLSMGVVLLIAILKLTEALDPCHNLADALHYTYFKSNSISILVSPVIKDGDREFCFLIIPLGSLGCH